jgi:D-glycero-alpha-D-manno-heptose-7-phosphate kinase
MSMFRAVMPLKVGIAGGGSDLPAYYERRPGECVNIGINLTLTVTLEPGPPREPAILVPGSPDPAVALLMLKQSGLTEHGTVTVRSDSVPGCGLGCSSALAVGLTALRYALAAQAVPPASELAAEAWRSEAMLLGLPVGKQDHYATALGGLNDLSFRPDGVGIRPLACRPRGRELLGGCFLIAAVGAPRHSADILERQASQCRRGDPAVLAAITARTSLVPAFVDALTGGDLPGLAALMRHDWELKNKMDGRMYDLRVEEALGRALAAGAVAGRLLGAGGTGYLLLLCRPQRRNQLRRALEAHYHDVRPVAPATRGAYVTEVSL